MKEILKHRKGDEKHETIKATLLAGPSKKQVKNIFLKLKRIYMSIKYVGRTLF